VFSLEEVFDAEAAAAVLHPPPEDEDEEGFYSNEDPTGACQVLSQNDHNHLPSSPAYEDKDDLIPLARGITTQEELSFSPIDVLTTNQMTTMDDNQQQQQSWRRVNQQTMVPVYSQFSLASQSRFPVNNINNNTTNTGVV
jgi:hypothetical protein